MTTTILSVLCSRGDLKLTWDHDDPESREKARAEVAALQEQGYSFFLTSGEPADSVQAGQGELVVKRLTADEVIEPPSKPVEVEAEAAEETPKKRGRPKGVRSVVAVRPLRGG